MLHKGEVANKNKHNAQDEQEEAMQELTEKSLEEVKGGIMKTKHDTVKNTLSSPDSM